MNKIVVLSFVILFIVVLLTGCNGVGYDHDGRIKEVTQGLNYMVIYDTETGVEYIRYTNGGITPLYNADGTLKLHTEEEND